MTYGAAAFSVQPFNNYLVSVSLTGQNILDLLNEQWNDNDRVQRKILQVAASYTCDKTLAGRADGGRSRPGSVMVDTRR